MSDENRRVQVVKVVKVARRSLSDVIAEILKEMPVEVSVPLKVVEAVVDARIQLQAIEDRVRYLAPEQCSRGDWDEVADILSGLHEQLVPPWLNRVRKIFAGELPVRTVSL